MNNKTKDKSEIRFFSFNCNLWNVFGLFQFKKKNEWQQSVEYWDAITELQFALVSCEYQHII